MQGASKREPGKFCRTPSFRVYQATETDTLLQILAIFIGLKGQNMSRRQIHVSLLWPLKNLCFLPNLRFPFPVQLSQQCPASVSKFVLLGIILRLFIFFFIWFSNALLLNYWIKWLLSIGISNSNLVAFWRLVSLVSTVLTGGHFSIGRLPLVLTLCRCLEQKDLCIELWLEK